MQPFVITVTFSDWSYAAPGAAPRRGRGEEQMKNPVPLAATP
jgi:hypothetical protein